MSSEARFDPRYPWLLAGAAAWFGAWGMQQVLVPWLVVNVLRSSATQTGLVQMATMLPTIFLLPFGGAVADRVDARWLLASLHVAAGMAPLAIALSIPNGALSLELLIGAALFTGLVNSFSNPSRDSLLSRVAGSDLTRAVAGVITAQFLAQGIGMLLASNADEIGAPAALAIQAAIVALGAAFCFRLPGRMAPTRARQPLRAEELLAGGRFVWGSELRFVWPLIAGVGLFFSGAYNVLFPVMVRDVYQSGVDELSVLLFAFPAGTIFASGWLFFRGIRRKGRALALSQAVGALTLIGCGADVPFWATVAFTFVWGLAGGVFMTTGRALFQERAPLAERARIMAVHQLAMVASGPLGALLSGALGDAIGPLWGTAALGGLMLALIATVLSLSDVWRME
ncbi:MAG TPA: MFS transporter [Myxococcota bacterium]|nr:MFS transporter [Myxococcota bacterium]